MLNRKNRTCECIRSLFLAKECFQRDITLRITLYVQLGFHRPIAIILARLKSGKEVLPCKPSCSKQTCKRDIDIVSIFKLFLHINHLNNVNVACEIVKATFHGNEKYITR